MIFRDRYHAGEELVLKLQGRVSGDERVLGIPRGGVVIAEIIAKRFRLKQEVLVTKKIGYPGHEELAMGAIAETGEPVWDKKLRAQVSEELQSEALKKAREKVKEYVNRFRKGEKLLVKGKVVIVVDDGIATGQTMEAGIKWLRKEGSKKVVVAVPVCAKETAEKLKKLVDEWICIYEPKNFYAVGQWYEQFSQVVEQ